MNFALAFLVVADSDVVSSILELKGQFVDISISVFWGRMSIGVRGALYLSLACVILCYTYSLCFNRFPFFIL